MTKCLSYKNTNNKHYFEKYKDLNEKSNNKNFQENIFNIIIYIITGIFIIFVLDLFVRMGKSVN